MNAQFIKLFDSEGNAQFVGLFSNNLNSYYELQIKTSITDWNTLSIVDVETNSVVQTSGLIVGETYTARVRLVENGTTGPWSNEVSVEFAQFGTIYSLVQDLASALSSVFSFSSDGNIPTSSLTTTEQDGLSKNSVFYKESQDNMVKIYEYIVHNFDGISSFSTKIMMNHDHISKVSSKVNFIFDSKSIISSLSSYYVEMDSKASVSESVDVTQDIKIDTSFAYLAVQDSRASISVIGVWKVFCDNLAKVHLEIITNEDLISKISCTLESSFDSKISSSSEVSINQDVHLTIKTALQLSFDSEGKFARTYEEFQEAIAGVSSGYAVIQDGKIHVIQVDFTQMAKIDLESFGLTVISTESETRITKALESTSRISIVKF